MRTTAPARASLRVERVGVVVAGDVDERPAGVDDPADEVGLQRRARVAEVADEEQRPAVGGPLERGDGEDVRVQVRGDGEPREAVERLPARRIGDESRQADELRVELVVEARRGQPQGLQRLQRARDVRAVGVVLRLGVRAERGRQQERDEQRREQRGAAGDRERDPQAQRRVRPRGERHQRAEPEAGDQDRHEQDDDEVADRARRLGADRRDVEVARLRDPDDGVAVDRPHVDLQPHRQADATEPHAPVDEGRVDVERATMPRIDVEAHRADGERALRLDRRQSAVGAPERGDDDGRQNESPAQHASPGYEDRGKLRVTCASEPPS